MNFGEKIRSARLEKHLSQVELANITGLALRTIQNYELGGRKPKSKESYEKLAAALGLDVSDLMSETDSFVMNAQTQYGTRGRRQAEEVVRRFRVAAAGGELDDSDLDFIKDAMMQTYLDAKRYNQRFANKKNKEQNEDSDKE